MFGFVSADSESLSKESREKYRGYYCGLCEKLNEKYGALGRMTLNFDMTFLVIFLSAYFSKNSINKQKRCVMHPIKKHITYENEFTDYAAEMNILLTYYKFCDDVLDDNSGRAKLNLRIFEKYAQKVKENYPVKSQRIERELKNIGQAEKYDEHNPDIPAGFFGNIMGEIFDIYSKNEDLYNFGYALGKVIYIMDACIDLKQDIKKCRYNPMVEISSADFQQILTILLCDCTDIYDKMNLNENREIIENILFSGIWEKYRRTFK